MASDRLRRVTILSDAGLDVKAVAAAVGALGPRVEQIEVTDDLDALAAGLSKQRPDLVVNLCERFAMNPQLAPDVAAALDLMQIPYTGPGPATLHVGSDADLARRLLASHGVPVMGEGPREDGELASIAVVGNGDEREIFAVPPTTAAGAQAVGELAGAIWEVLRLRDYALIEAQVVEGRAVVRRVVPHPALDPEAPFAAAVRRGGWTYERLIRRILAEAWDRKQEERRAVESPLA